MTTLDDAAVRSFAEAHGAAVVAGDMAHVLGDMTPEAQAGAGPVAGALPQPTTAAEVLSIEPSGDAAVVHIRYSGPEKELTVRSVWKQVGERPLIVEASPA